MGQKRKKWKKWRKWNKWKSKCEGAAESRQT
jgi:hypothetical protein